MTRGTTPTFAINVSGVDLTLAHNIYATLEQGNIRLQKSTGKNEITVTQHSVSFALTQLDTLRFQPTRKENGTIANPVVLKLNWTYDDGKRGCTKDKLIEVEDNVERQVLE